MTTSTTSRRLLLAAAALLAFALAAPGCGRPPDEAWLRFLGFRNGDGETIAMLEGDLFDGRTEAADAVFRNTSVTVGGGSDSTGTGVTVTYARVEYSMARFSPPSDRYQLNLYLGPSSVADGALAATEETLANFPVVPSSLKQWLIDTHAFDKDSATPAVELTAKVTFLAETDEGGELEVSGSIAIVLDNNGSAGSSETESAAIGRGAVAGRAAAAAGKGR